MATIAIVGSRRTTKAVNGLVTVYVRTLPRGTVVLSGGARGVDTVAVRAAQGVALETRVIEANWEQHGYAAGFIRNKEVVRAADKVVAWWDGVSRGTANTIDLARKAGKLDKVFRFSRLVVFTARIGCKDPDVLDITRKSGKAGLAFAPSWDLLKPMIDKRRAGASTDADWNDYVEGYLHEMRASYRRGDAAWAELLSRSRVVLVCYCTDPARCHRVVMAQRVLGPLGVTYRGELT